MGTGEPLGQLNRDDSARGLLATLLGASLLGFAAIFVRWSGSAGPVVIGFYRMLFALPLVAVMAWKAPGVSPGNTRTGTAWAVAAGLCFVADLWTWHVAMRHTSAANATLLVGLAPIWVALLSVGLLGARLRKRFWAGLALALAGAAVLGFVKGARWGTGRGEFLGAVASIWYALFTLAMARSRSSLSAPRALAWVVVVCLGAFGLLGWAQGDVFAGFSTGTWLAFAGLGVVVQVAAWWFITWGLGHISASLASIGLLTQSIATVFLGWLLLGEAVKPLQGLGAALVLLGIALAALAPPMPKIEAS